MLEVNQVVKNYGDKQILKEISFKVEKGDSFGFLGPNGAGKSTLISIITGLYQPTDGYVLIEGYDSKGQQKKAQQMIGIVPQEIALYLNMTAKENLIFWGRMYGLKGKLLKKRVRETLEIIGLEERANDKVKLFSGGMKRRVNIGCAILHKPKILIMDEPTVGIDPQSRNHILETVKRLNQDGMTIVYTSHYMEEVEYLCDKIGIIDQGSLVALGTIAELSKLVEEQREIILTIKNNKADIEKVSKYIRESYPSKDLNVEGQKFKISDQKPQEFISKLIQVLTDMKVEIISAEVVEPNLENVFLYLTGKKLRD
ncbi:ABC transporter ATP-binding protein [Bacillus pumilus]|uniref:ABC transporter ATP-binding protein n=1 Tax=Bacillus pumilus TaxID=1408 RepID=UPI001B3A4D2E|nr:ABC transporter ATP-binding protein [Bacillus pumilus]MBQ4815451.1 ABC transporter ATP-binding protein [Bacillus pumilus]WIG30739.1 ABC transporter ATP-binding protein [Bacillus pumilus]